MIGTIGTSSKSAGFAFKELANPALLEGVPRSRTSPTRQEERLLLMKLEELAGQKLVLGIDGAKVTPEIIQLFQKTYAGGLIVFKRNIPSAASLKNLISDLELALGRRLLVMIDHEGGRVIHLGEAVTIFPDAQALGLSGRADWAKAQGEIEALELRRLGIDMNLAPVLDVATSEWNPAIGTRSYSRDAKLVGILGAARIQGMQSKGLWACAKHYPGLGEARHDPHHDLPTIRKNWKAMQQTDLVPFMKAVEVDVDGIMTSHPTYPELDPHPNLPATFSRRIVHDSLRLELGYQGLILSDDLKMGAITKTASFKEGIPLAAKAGHDLLLVCSDPKAQLEAFDSLLWAYKKKDLKTSELEESVERISQLKAKRKERFFPGDLKSEQTGKTLAQEIAQAGVQIISQGNGLLPLSPAWCLNHSFRVIFPDLSPIAKERFLESSLLDPEPFVRQNFSQYGVPLKKLEKIPLQPTPKEREMIVENGKGEELTLFFCWDARQFSETRELLKDLQAENSRLVVMLLREPEDREWIGPKTACLSAHGFRMVQTRALIEKLFSG